MVFLNTVKSLEWGWSWQRQWITSIFIMSDRAAFRSRFRIEVNQTSKVELYTCKIASFEQLKASSCEPFSHKVPSSMVDCVPPTRGKTTQIGLNITYLWKVAMGSYTCTLSRTYKIGMLKLPLELNMHNDWKQKVQKQPPEVFCKKRCS